MGNFYFILLGIIWIIWGIIICIKPVAYLSRWGITSDLTGINVPFGIAQIAIGAALLWVTLKKKD